MVFRLFRKRSRSLSRRSSFHRPARIGGTGLGLPIIRSLLQVRRGTIMLDRNDATGAAFLVRLPACAATSTRNA